MCSIAVMPLGGTESDLHRVLCRGIWRETKTAVKWIDKRIIVL